ncbi:MAG: riboflavin synthase [Candidatus Krumholzibacteriia bacterium]
MFTGLVREIGVLRGVGRRGGIMRLDIAAPVTAARVAPGDSVAVAGICLTVTAVRGPVFSVEAASETRRLTTLQHWRVGRRLHLEPALRVGDPLDGHLVQGHVDGVGTVRAVRRAGRDLLVTVSLGPDLARFLVPKGSVALDGVSLTVDEGPHTDRFTVNLIPHTLQGTTFAGLKPGRPVNLEMDVLVKAARAGGLAGLPAVAAADADAGDAAAPLTMDRLRAAGFGRRPVKGRP